MRIKKTSKYTVLFDSEEVKEALIYWLSTSRSTTTGIKIASMMNNSECKISRTEQDPVVVHFEWEEKEDEDKP